MHNIQPTRKLDNEEATSRFALNGVGIGLRTEHYRVILEQYHRQVPWFEVLIDNYMGAGGLPLYYLDKFAQAYPLAFHGVGMSLCSVDSVNQDYLKKLKSLIDRFQPKIVSDHLAWVSVHGRYLHDLLPIPYTKEALSVIAEHIDYVQNYLQRSILIENPSTYLAFKDSEMTEWDFINQLVTKTGCGILLDVNNVYVTCFNHQLDPIEYVSEIKRDAVGQIHLGGYEDRGKYLFDTHGEAVHPPVWELYQSVIDLFGQVPTLIEWDTNLPEFSVLYQHAKQAEAILEAHGG